MSEVNYQASFVAAGAKPKRDHHSPATLPLCVDLDGTLVRSDMLAEGFLSLLTRPSLAGPLLRAVFAGRAGVKQAVARVAAFDPALLPFHQALLAWLRTQKASGRQLILVTAADVLVATSIAHYLGLFDEVIASDGKHNLKGANKAARLVERFGEGGFVYAADSRVDLAVWSVAAGAVLVEASPTVAAAAAQLCPIEATFADAPPRLPALLRAMRIHQWSKNLLVFVPLFVSGAAISMTVAAEASIAFLAFSFTASGIYLVNDLLDLAADRSHPRKRLRPFASGALPVQFGVGAAIVLLTIGLAASFVGGVLAVMMLYTLLSTTYSMRLKQLPIVDVFMLAGLYTVRQVAGGEATHERVSLWLLAFSSFLFLSLALVKRVGELSTAQNQGSLVARRGYFPGDVVVLQTFGCASAVAASVVLALFVQNEAHVDRYASPTLLWCIVPVVFFWQFRIWLSTARGYMHDDPIVYAARDWVSWLVVMLIGAIVLTARNSSVLT